MDVRKFETPFGNGNSSRRLSTHSGLCAMTISGVVFGLLFLILPSTVFSESRGGEWEFCTTNPYHDHPDGSACFSSLTEAEEWMRREACDLGDQGCDVDDITGRRFLELDGSPTTYSNGIIRYDYDVRPRPPEAVEEDYLYALSDYGTTGQACGCPDKENFPDHSPCYAAVGSCDDGRCNRCLSNDGDVQPLLDAFAETWGDECGYEVVTESAVSSDNFNIARPHSCIDSQDCGARWMSEGLWASPPLFVRSSATFNDNSFPQNNGHFAYSNGRSAGDEYFEHNLRFRVKYGGGSCDEPAAELLFKARRQQRFECEVGLRPPSSEPMNPQGDRYSPDELLTKEEVCRGYQSGWIKAKLIPSKQCEYGNPCVPATGSKIKREVDFSVGSLSIERTYHSLRLASSNSHFGTAWHGNFGDRLLVNPGSDPDDVFYVDSDGRYEKFEIQEAVGTYNSTNEFGLTLSKEPDGNWILRRPGGEVRQFSEDGRLQLIEQTGPEGYELSMQYGPDGLLHLVEDRVGRALTFHYDQTGPLDCESASDQSACSARRVSRVELPDGHEILYGYDSEGRLESVEYANGARRLYHYNETENICPADAPADTCSGGTVPDGGFPDLLTGISDEFVGSDGTLEVSRYSTYQYDHHERAISSALADGLEQTRISYLSNDEAVVTYPEGGERHIEFTTIANAFRKDDLWVDRTDPSGEAIETDFEYDSSGRLDWKSDPRGTVTRYEYGGDGLHQSAVVEADGTPEQRRTETEWAPGLTRVSEKRVYDAQGVLVRLTRNDYDADGRLVARCEYDPNDSEAVGYECSDSVAPPTGEPVRRWTWAYCDSSSPDCPLEGLLVASTVPGDDPAEPTEYHYYAHTSEQGCAEGPGDCFRAGDLWMVVNPLGHVVEYLSYDQAGRPIRILDANGVINELQYSPRGWLESSTVDEETTTYVYSPNGLLEKTVHPDGSFLEFEYDSAERLEAVENALGERIEFVLDEGGNIELQEMIDSDGDVRYQLERVYDQLGRLDAMVSGTGQTTDYEYEPGGSVEKETDPLGNATESEYDPLGRLDYVLDALGGVTAFSYDAVGNSTEVVDSEGLATSYQYNAFDELTTLDSPDTGTTSYTYDEAGNRETRTDARGVTTTFSYDAVNRLIGVQFPDSSLDIAYFYDEDDSVTGCEQSYPVGRLTRMMDPSGTTVYCYDARGSVTKKTQTVGLDSVAVGYDHDEVGRLTGITYPSGRKVIYSRDAGGRVTSLQLSPGDSQRVKTIVSAVDYLPFGPVKQYTFGNQEDLVRSHNLDYDVTEVESPALDLQLHRDAVGNIDQLGMSGGAQSIVEEYVYDDLYRLEAVQDDQGGNIESYAYDLIGNRQSKTTDFGTEMYDYAVDSHHLVSVDGNVRTHDAVGNLVSDSQGSRDYVYGDHNRLSEFSAPRVNADYVHNGRGQRTSKVVNESGSTKQVYFVYDESGRLLAELSYPPMGLYPVVRREYVYLEDIPVAVIDYESGQTTYYVHADHLGTPRAVSDGSGVKRWEWQFQSNPFGEVSADEDPGNTGDSFELNLRFPGQYYDSESGLHYNYFRDYEPQTGRYVQSDPIGLAGGLNTFAYAYDNPLRFTDPFGKNPFDSLSDFCIGEGCICQVMPGLCPSPPPKRCLSCTEPEYSMCISQAIASAGPPCVKFISSRNPREAIKCGVEAAQIALCVAQYCTRSTSNCEEESCGG